MCIIIPIDRGCIAKGRIVDECFWERTFSIFGPAMMKVRKRVCG